MSLIAEFLLVGLCERSEIFSTELAIPIAIHEGISFVIIDTGELRPNASVVLESCR